MLCNNIKNLMLFFSFFAVHGNNNEFVQPKKGHKRSSVTTLKENNIEACSSAFESSANLVEGMGRFQKKLQHTVNRVVKEDIRNFQEQTEEQLTQINSLLQQMEDLLQRCEKSIITVIS